MIYSTSFRKPRILLWSLVIFLCFRCFLMNHLQKAQTISQTWLWKTALKAFIVHIGNSYITLLSLAKLSIFFSLLLFIILCFIEFFRHMTHDCITIGNSGIEIWSEIDPELDDGCRAGKWHGRNVSHFLSILTFLWKINETDIKWHVH